MSFRQGLRGRNTAEGRFELEGSDEHLVVYRLFLCFFRVGSPSVIKFIVKGVFVFVSWLKTGTVWDLLYVR